MNAKLSKRPAAVFFACLAHFLPAAGVLCLALSPGSDGALLADVIHLKDNTTVTGKFLGNDGEFATVLTDQGERKIKSNEIESVEVGYSGVPLCYATKDDPTRRCGAVLHKLGPEKAIIATDGNTRREEIPADEIVFLEFDKAADEKALSVLQKGARVKLKMGDKTIEGKVDRKADGSFELKMEDGTSRKLEESEITGGLVTSGLLAGWNWSALIPGLPQIQRGSSAKGYAIMGTMGAFGVVGLVEYLNAEAADAKAASDFRFKFFNDQTLYKEFEAHQQNQLYMGVAALFLYAYHFYDYFTFTGPARAAPRKPGASKNVSYDLMLGSRPVGRAALDSGLPGQGARMETVYGASFTVRF